MSNLIRSNPVLPILDPISLSPRWGSGAGTIPYWVTHNPIATPIARLGRVEQILALPNQPNPEIWVLAFWRTAPKLAWALMKPFWLASQWTRLGVGHRPKRARWKVPVAGLMDPINLIKAMGMENPGAAGRDLQVAATWAKFEVPANLALRALWYLFVLDVGSKFLLNWASLAYTWGGNPIRGSTWGQIKCENAPLLGFAEATGLYTTLWHPTPGSTIVGGGFGIAVPPGIDAAVSWSCTGVVMDPPGEEFFPKSFTFRLYDTHNEVELQRGFQHSSESGSRTTSNIYTGWMDSSVTRVVTVLTDKSEGALSITGDISVNAFPQPFKGPMADP